MTLTDRSIMPLGPHAGKRMLRVPVEWLEEFASTAHSSVDEEHDAVLEYIRVNRVRLDKLLDAQEAYA